MHPWQKRGKPREESALAVDVVGVLLGWLEKLLGVRGRQSAANTRIADGALPLRRSLAATFEAWPQGPRGREELAKWAFKMVDGFAITEPALRALVALRPDASPQVHRAIGVVHKEYYAVADILNAIVPGVMNPGIKRSWEPQGGSGDADRLAAGAASLRRAWARMRRCLAALDSVG